MSQIVRLDNIDHADLRVHRTHGAEFGEAVNQVAVFATEFEAVQRHYPILFHPGADGALQPLAVLGLDRDENLFLHGERWDADYIPALFRRGALMVDMSQDAEAAIHVDLASPRIADATDHGEALFLPHGGQAPALTSAIEALRVIMAGAQVTPALTAMLVELELVQPVRLQVNPTDEATYDFAGYHAVTAERIAALGGEALDRLNRAGFLDLAIFAASSLANMNRLAARKRARLASA
jgi:hypothetical protein